MCIDKVGSGCAPPKQIFYFDISRPNTYIEDAAHINATLVTPQIETCDPTVSPSNHPTQSPSNEPSITPSGVTANPTASPSYHPTKSPSNEPSVSLIRDPFEYEQFTIEINLNSCTNDGSEPCTFEETED
eukprot:106405_1